MSNEKNQSNSQGNLELVIKAQFGDDIRRIKTFPYISLNELVLLVQRVFQEKLSTDIKMLLKYHDEDGDLVTIQDSSDLKDAVKCSQKQSPKILVVVDTINQAPQHSQQQQLGCAESCANNMMDPNAAVDRGCGSSKLHGTKYHPYSTICSGKGRGIPKVHGNSLDNHQQTDTQSMNRPKQKKQSQKQKQPKQAPDIGLESNLPNEIVRSNIGTQFQCQICVKTNGSKVFIDGLRNVEEHVRSKRHTRNLRQC